MNLNNFSYSYSYRASRILAEEALKSNQSVKYIIDLHRDSIPESASTITINDKNYARVMFVISTMKDNYEKNLELASRIDIKEKSGIYNQDLSDNALLIEVGGEYNDINSVSNTLVVLANAYKKVILEDGYKEET